jgi:UDP-N-acetylmuramate dehydrogenase
LVSFLTRHQSPFIVNALLKNYITFRIGGPCPLLIDCATPERLVSVIPELARFNMDFIVIGDGSNLLAADSGITEIVLRYVSASPHIKIESSQLTVSAATRFDDLVQYTVENGIDNFFNCSGIPGTVGGAIAGNAGAFGWQIADQLLAIEVMDRQGRLYTRQAGDLGFRYRHSEIGNIGYIILTATFAISSADRRGLAAERQRILTVRQSKHPDVTVIPTAGSFFKNIEPTSKAERRQAAGYYLELAGAKLMQVGGAGVFEKHANIIVRKSPACTARDIDELAQMMAAGVQEKFGIVLQQEVRYLGNP